MARQALPIDLNIMQKIIRENENTYQGGLIDFLNHCCNIYNEKIKPEKKLYGQIVYGYIKKGKIFTAFKATRKVLSEEQKSRMQEGRKNPNPYDDDDDNEVPEKFQELHNLLIDINKRKGTNYKLELSSGFGQIAGDDRGPCLPHRHLKTWILGLGAM